jgi:hypothetical protein
VRSRIEVYLSEKIARRIAEHRPSARIIAHPLALPLDFALKGLDGAPRALQDCPADLATVLKLLAMSNSVKAPSALWYVLGAALIAAGVGIFAVVLWQGITHIADGLTQVVVPGSVDLKLHKPGEYTIFLERESVVNGRIYSLSGALSGLECKVHSKETGDSIPLRRPSMSTTYTVGGRSGESVLAFRIDRPGSYEISCGYDEGYIGPEAVVAVGSEVGSGIFRTIGYCVLAMFGGFGLGLTVIIVTAVKRQKARNATMPPPAPATGFSP